MSKNVLVTGGSGFIGSHVVDTLIKKKCNVTVIDLNSPKRKDVKFIKGSILNKSLIESSLKNIDYIFHLAAVSDINKVEKIPTKTIETNILGTTYLLEASRKAKIKRFIFAGSYYSYGDAGNLYTTSKTASELVIRNYNLLYKQKFTILRYSTAYGPRNREVDALSIFVDRAMKNLDLVIHGDGKQKRDYIYVKDLAEGSMIGLEKMAENKIFTLTSNKRIKIYDLAKMILKLTNSKSKIVLNKNKKRFDDFSSNYSYNNNEKIPKKWSPKYDIKSGLKEYIIEKYR